ncbi:MAG: efflux RND transporter periplasmic adaptor subunit [Pirellulaceae bacterium]|jgi:RND family efflux transporter MFP subunit|nr:efflux RND transporter periplasmic adaptor subunit [Pirellulaceae bacterium]MDP6718365.1 efflux RND transporter periplasmic adaptor subunit [Pirellulaceae bacterium]
MGKDVDLRELAIDRGGTDHPGVSASSHRLRRHLLTRYVLPLVLVLGFVLLVAWASRDFIFPPKAVTVIPVFSTTAEVRLEGTPLFKAAGWIEPRPTPVRVAALAPGVVEDLLVIEDQAVKADEPIAELVKDDAELAHQRALVDLELRQAELDEANATLIAAKTRLKYPVHLQAALGEADAALATVGTLLKNLPFEILRAEADHQAMQKDYDAKRAADGVVAGVEIDKAKSQAARAKALVEELRNRSESLKKEQAALGQRRDALKTQLKLLADEIRAKDEATAKVKGAAARIAQARVVVAQAKLQLSRMTVVSPIDGRVFRLIAHPGARIGSGMTQMTGHDGSTVVTLYRPDMLQIRVDVRFEDIPKVSLDQPVEIDNPALSSPLVGKVLFISSEADKQKNTLQVKVVIPDPPPVFKPEMLVDVTFLSQRSHESRDESQATEPRMTRIFIPQQFVKNEGDLSYVWLADQSAQIARKQEIQTGSPGEHGLIEVSQGLNISSRIIAVGSDDLTDGCRIHITSEPQNRLPGL